MVLHRADDDFVAGNEQRAGVALGDQVDRFGGSAHEDDFRRNRGMDECLHADPRRLECIGRALAQRMHAPMHIGIVFSVKARNRVDYRLRFLRGGCVVEINDPLAMHAALQDRERPAPARHAFCRNGRRNGSDVYRIHVYLLERTSRAKCRWSF